MERKLTEYLHAVEKSMLYLAMHPKTLFVGQATRYNGTAITQQLKSIPDFKKVELPVAEDFQMGFCLGLALEGYIPVSIFPRVNFAFLAINQLANHMDKWQELTQGESKPKIIVKMCIGSDKPLDPGPQHKGNYTRAFKILCPNTEVIELKSTKNVFPAYQKALEREDGRSTIIIEHANRYSVGRLWKL